MYSRILVKCRSSCRCSQMSHLRYLCVNVTGSPKALFFKSIFSLQEQEKILNTLNHSSSDDLERLNLSKNRIKNLVNCKSKRGPFRTLNDILEVEGLGEKILEKICKTIITNTVVEKTDKNKNNGINKKNKLATPPLSGSLVENLQTAVGIHLGPVGISWAKLSRHRNELCNWNYDDFGLLPKKMLLPDTFNLAINIIRKIPLGDVYIFEANSTMSPQGQAQSATITSYTHQLELTSMLIALINTSIKHNSFLQKAHSNGENERMVENKVFFLRSKLPARLFKTLVGTERVSAVETITKLVESNADDNFSLPCTRVHLENSLRNVFASQTSANKELLAQALMLIVSFMDLCIYKNSVSLSAIYPNRHRKLLA